MAFSNRKEFLKQVGSLALGVSGISAFPKIPQTPVDLIKPFFTISLAEWSLHRTIKSGKMTNLDFPVVAKNDYGISVVEYVNGFFMDKATDTKYLNELLARCKDNEVKNHLIRVTLLN